MNDEILRSWKDILIYQKMIRLIQKEEVLDVEEERVVVFLVIELYQGGKGRDFSQFRTSEITWSLLKSVGVSLKSVPKQNTFVLFWDFFPKKGTFLFCFGIFSQKKEHFCSVLRFFFPKKRNIFVVFWVFPIKRTKMFCFGIFSQKQNIFVLFRDWLQLTSKLVKSSEVTWSHFWLQIIFLLLPPWVFAGRIRFPIWVESKFHELGAEFDSASNGAIFKGGH